MMKTVDEDYGDEDDDDGDDDDDVEDDDDDEDDGDDNEIKMMIKLKMIRMMIFRKSWQRHVIQFQYGCQ